MGKAFVVFTGVMVLGAGSAFAIKFGLGRVAEEIRESPGFVAGWQKAESHPALLAAIGPPVLAPFSLLDFVSGKQRWDFTTSIIETMETAQGGGDEGQVPSGLRSVRTERNEIDVPIQGPRGRGQLIVHAAEVPGQGWSPTKLEARIEGQGTALDLLGGAPPP